MISLSCGDLELLRKTSGKGGGGGIDRVSAILSQKKQRNSASYYSGELSKYTNVSTFSSPNPMKKKSLTLSYVHKVKYIYKW